MRQFKKERTPTLEESIMLSFKKAKKIRIEARNFPLFQGSKVVTRESFDSVHFLFSF